MSKSKEIKGRRGRSPYKKIASFDARLESSRNSIARQFLVVRRRIVGRINAGETFQRSCLCKMSSPFLFPGGSIKEKRDFEFHDGWVMDCFLESEKNLQLVKRKTWEMGVLLVETIRACSFDTRLQVHAANTCRDQDLDVLRLGQRVSASFPDIKCRRLSSMKSEPKLNQAISL